MTGRKKT